MESVTHYYERMSYAAVNQQLRKHTFRDINKYKNGAKMLYNLHESSPIMVSVYEDNQTQRTCDINDSILHLERAKSFSIIIMLIEIYLLLDSKRNAPLYYLPVHHPP